MQQVNIWVDPMCPFAWMTSQWLLEVEKVRNIRARFNVMSLSVLNEGRDELPEDYKERMRNGFGPVRVAIAVEREHGEEALRAFYLAIAGLHHNDGREFGPGLYEEALTMAGLDTDLAVAASDASLDEPLRESHHAGMDPVGQDVGTPVVHFPDGGRETTAFFGPVIVPPPAGEEAGRLWDGLRVVASTDGLYELKRSRDRDPEFLAVS